MMVNGKMGAFMEKATFLSTKGRNASLEENSANPFQTGECSREDLHESVDEMTR